MAILPSIQRAQLAKRDNSSYDGGKLSAALIHIDVTPALPIVDICGTTIPQEISIDNCTVPYPRNVCAEITEDASNCKKVSITIYGRTADGKEISEDLPCFVAKKGGLVSGKKAFATIDMIKIPNIGDCRIRIGFGGLYGLCHNFAHNTLIFAFGDDLPIDTLNISTDKDNAELNTVDLDNAEYNSLDMYMLV